MLRTLCFSLAKEQSFIESFLPVVLGIELRASCILGKCIFTAPSLAIESSVYRGCALTLNCLGSNASSILFIGCL